MADTQSDKIETVVLAPAKLNLTLEVLAERPDSFHEIRSVIQTINLCDSLRFKLSRNIEIKPDEPQWIPAKSLISKAVRLVQEVTGCTKGVSIEVNKRIPLMSGLGGDSTDAAATLRGLNKIWKLGLSQEKLLELAGQLGSDVPFFLYGGTAFVEGRGEKVAPLPPLLHLWVVLVIPAAVPRLPGKTKELYARLQPGHYTDGRISQRLVAVLKAGKGFEPSLLFNTFENVAFTYFPQLSVYREHIVKIGADNVHLAGSGPTLFTLVKDRTQAEELHTRLQQQGLESYLTETLATVENKE